ncbi:MAG: DUF4139 domain-containing protein, partial [Candidatus Tectomicrobia bacterium]|nr:DUF4139 domain-containing protein [Candidatus Tectomicrobia bacterium]
MGCLPVSFSAPQAVMILVRSDAMQKVRVLRRVLWVGLLSMGWWTASLPGTANAQATPWLPLPLTNIVLYTSGVGYFQRDGQVDGHGQVVLRFKAETINDLLKSMIAQDFDGGQVRTVTYDSRDPLTRTLKSFAIDLTENAGLGHLLWQMRGERVDITTPNAVQGIILGVETKKERAGETHSIEVEYLNLLTDSGLRSLPLAQIQQLRVVNEQLNLELQQALAVLAASHDTQKKTVTFDFTGTGTRRVRVGYIMETPIWKTSYRLVLSETERPFLQGWALVENTTDEDWQDVRLTLMSGRPIAFTMDMYEPLYTQRPVVVPEVYAALRPQVYGQAMEKAGEAVKEAQLLEGRLDKRRHEALGGNADAPSPAGAAPSRALLAEPKVAAAPAPPPVPASLALDQGVESTAQTAEVGELFAYALSTPVSLPRQKSAMLPIVNDTVEGTKVAIYNQRVHARYPLHGLRLRNATALHLSQGPVTVFDGGVYAGDARLDDLPAGQERLLSYAMDLKTEVEPVSAPEQRELVTVSLRKGTLLVTQKAIAEKTYNIRNRDQKSRVVLVEHPFRAEWQLAAPTTASERTREAYRFTVTVEAGQGARLQVREEKPLQQSVALTDAGPDVLASYLRATQVS